MLILCKHIYIYIYTVHYIHIHKWRVCVWAWWACNAKGRSCRSHTMLPRRNVSGKAMGFSKTRSKQMIYRHAGGNKNLWQNPWKNPLQKMTSTIDLLWMVGFWHVNADRRVTWNPETRKELFPQNEFPGGYSLFFVLWRHMVKLRGCTLWSSCAKNRFMWWS